jgi:trimethylamine--corrinoid protein Co-methyltransferase
MYLDPQTGRLQEFTEETLVRYIRLAQRLDGVTGIHLQNLPLAAARVTEPLEVRIFAWKHGAVETGSIQLLALCPYLEELYAVRAEAEGRPLAEVFRGQAFLVSPLRLPAQEAAQVMHFHGRGLRVSLSSMLTAGGTAPVTMAACVALNLAESVAIGFIHRALYGDRSWSLGSAVAPLDMRTLIQPYGRPEMLLCNLAALQLARHYQVRGGVHSGLTDAKVPSHEAGVQKLLTALPCALAGGANIEPGLLSIDEVFSPVQMILDAELITAVSRVLRGFTVDEESLAVELIDQVGPGGLFTDREHTARYFRSELWEPRLWSRQMLSGWLADGCRTDADRALELWHQLMSEPVPDPDLSPQTEARLWTVVERARQAL